MESTPLNSEKEIIKKDLRLPQKVAFTLENVVSPEYCTYLIDLSERGGYERATLSVEDSIKIESDIRTGFRHVHDDPEIAGLIFEKIKPHLPEEWNSSGLIERKLLCVNERLRFLRYTPGQYFARHMDGWFSRKNGERSWLTLQLYLNEGFQGGETTIILDSGLRIPIIPKTGMVLIFQHDIVHEGSVLLGGTKYTIRSDIMYSQTLKTIKSL
eukprot:TRINITY_DN9535_c0_g2_i1.p1 TRINITY_DN9535_c0_g2~~TRINITY_DN9535_c0_g2_i1.p1  ORF type:complete len:239 (+),score=29.68 TRINITY_DN9535_c0_g2_i1:79-717(+)